MSRKRILLLAVALVAAGASACAPQGTASSDVSPSAGAAMTDCGALQRLETAAQAVGALKEAAARPASISDLFHKADAVMNPVKDVLAIYSATSRSDPQAAAIQAAAEDLADGAGFFESSQVGGASPPPSGLGSRQWALDQLDRGVASVAEATTLLQSPGPGASACH